MNDEAIQKIISYAKVIEMFGEKKNEAVKDAIAKDKVEKNPVVTREVIITEKGNTLCYDAVSGRYFKGDIEKIKKAECELNRQMRDSKLRATLKRATTNR